MQQDLRCASDSYRFDLRSDITSQGGAISGRFLETSRNVGGNISGRASPGTIQARAEGAGFLGEPRGLDARQPAVGDHPGARRRGAGSLDHHAQGLSAARNRQPSRRSLVGPALREPAQEGHGRPQDEEVGDERGDHRKGAEPAEQAQARQVGEHRHGEPAGEHQRGQDEGRADQDGGPLDPDRRVLPGPVLQPQPVQEVDRRAEP
jgi:hypothetical protein